MEIISNFKQFNRDYKALIVNLVKGLVNCLGLVLKEEVWNRYLKLNLFIFIQNLYF